MPSYVQWAGLVDFIGLPFSAIGRSHVHLGLSQRGIPARGLRFAFGHNA